MNIKEAYKILQLLHINGKLNSKQLSEKKEELNKLEELEIQGFIEKLPNHSFYDKEIEETEPTLNINIGTKGNQVLQDKDKAFLILSFCCGIKASYDKRGIDYIDVLENYGWYEVIQDVFFFIFLSAILSTFIFGVIPAAIVSKLTKSPFSYKFVFIFMVLVLIISTLGQIK